MRNRSAMQLLVTAPHVHCLMWLCGLHGCSRIAIVSSLQQNDVQVVFAIAGLMLAFVRFLRRSRKNRDANDMGITARAVDGVSASEAIEFKVTAIYLSVVCLSSEALAGHISTTATISQAASINESLTAG